jgi:hypothetical protein
MIWLMRGLFLVVFLAFLPVSNAAYNYVHSPSPAFSDVLATYNAAAPGDVVYVPAGTNDWLYGQHIVLDKPITIMGSGMNSTVIVKPRPAHIDQGDEIFKIETGGVRVTGFTFDWPRTATNIGVGVIAVGPQAYGYRVDHCRFLGSTDKDTVAIRALGGAGDYPWGVHDNNIFWNFKIHTLGHGDYRAHYSWFQATDLGGPSALYSEDNFFEGTKYARNCHDGNDGGRYVARFNTLLNTQFEVHGRQTNSRRGSRKSEIYGNNITHENTLNFYWILVRGGTGIIASNTLTRYTPASQGCLGPAIDTRSVTDYTPLSWGQDPLRDTNEPYDFDKGVGVHNGPNGSETLIDTTRNWQELEFYSYPVDITKGTKFYLWNETTKAGARIISWTSTEVVAPLTQTPYFPNVPRLTWNAGDSYKITGGYRPRDGFGTGKDDYLSTQTEYAPQALEPFYVWGNLRNGILQPPSVRNFTGFWVKLGRDFYTNAHPTWVPYTYPHPLRTTLNAPPPGELPVLSEVGFLEGQVSIYENEGNVVLTVRRAFNTSSVCSVMWATEDITAVGNVNYVSGNGMITFNSNEISKELSIGIIDNHTYNPNRQFRVTLTDPNNAHIDPLKQSAVVSIIEDDTSVKPRIRAFLVPVYNP